MVSNSSRANNNTHTLGHTCVFLSLTESQPHLGSGTQPELFPFQFLNLSLELPCSCGPLSGFPWCGRERGGEGGMFESQADERVGGFLIW